MQCGDPGGRRVGGAGGYRGVNGDAGRLDFLMWGGEHITQCADDVLWSCAPETCINVFTSVTPINSINREKILRWICHVSMKILISIVFEV